MPEYRHFTENSIFKNNYINAQADKLMTAIINLIPDAEEHIYIAGSLAKNMQDVINKPVKDLDIIVNDKKVFETLKTIGRYTGQKVFLNKYTNRIYVRATPNFLFEIWFNPKQETVIKKYGINQRKY